ncbi:MAG: hypothetical protein VB135_05265, partial [Burkholderia sp.]
ILDEINQQDTPPSLNPHTPQMTITLWMLAEDISTAAWEWPDLIDEAIEIADEVAKLAPDPDAEWDDEE